MKTGEKKIVLVVLGILGLCVSMCAQADTMTYVFDPSQSTVLERNWAFGYYEKWYSIEGEFQLTVNFNVGTAWFEWVDANLSEEIYYADGGFQSTQSLDVLFHMSELVSTDVDNTAIDFVFEKNNPTFPFADVHLQVTFIDDLAHLTGRFSDDMYDGDQYDLDAFALKCASSQVGWIPGEVGPADWSIEPANPTISDVIYFSGPTEVFSNGCVAEMNMGGTPTITIYPETKTIYLWFQPPPPEYCPYWWNPVCGLQGSFGPLEPGQWVFFSDWFVEELFIPFQVLGIYHVDDDAPGDPRWSEPVFIPELNDAEGNTAYCPSLSRDGLTMYFHRYIPSAGDLCIVEAYRDTPDGPFTSERVLTELSTTGLDVITPWISDDQLRLYYREETTAGGDRIKMAERSSVGELWTPVRTFDELHEGGAGGGRASLTADELTIFFHSGRPGSIGLVNLWMATRPDANSLFGDIRPLDEINSSDKDYRPCILPDGLTLYFDSFIGGVPQGDIYKATRSSTGELFGNVQEAPVSTDAYREVFPYVTPDEKTIYFNSDRGAQGDGIWVSYSTDLHDGLSPETAFTTIQEGIDAAQDGDTVLVWPGVYTESIDFLGKNITLTSTDPNNSDVVKNTIIVGSVLFSGTEDANCTLTGFSISDLFNGAIYGNHTQATISYCVISGNGPCGATAIRDCDGTISNCLITDNTTIYLCGVYPVIFRCHGLIKNCTIANNDSGVGVLDGGTTTMENCIIYNNGDPNDADPQIIVGSGGTVNISYCDVQGGLEGISGGGIVNWGLGNIDTDPCFVQLGYWEYEPWPWELVEGDYRLKSEGWRWDVGFNPPRWGYDYVTSRCIDAGNPGCALGDELMTVPPDPDNEWGVNLRINMGAYGGTAEASMAPHGWALLADLTNDGIASYPDLAGQVEDWLIGASEQPGDLNRDGVVNGIDFAMLGEDWLQATEWANWPPEVYITQPQDGAVISYALETIDICADAWDPDGSVVKVEFFANGSKIGQDDDGADGWGMPWFSFNECSAYSLTAKATDNEGATTASPAVGIIVECNPEL